MLMINQRHRIIYFNLVFLSSIFSLKPLTLVLNGELCLYKLRYFVNRIRGFKNSIIKILKDLNFRNCKSLTEIILQSDSKGILIIQLLLLLAFLLLLFKNYLMIVKKSELVYVHCYN
jgi:hypothetical protein